MSAPSWYSQHSTARHKLAQYDQHSPAIIAQETARYNWHSAASSFKKLPCCPSVGMPLAIWIRRWLNFLVHLISPPWILPQTHHICLRDAVPACRYNAIYLSISQIAETCHLKYLHNLWGSRWCWCHYSKFPVFSHLVILDFVIDRNFLQTWSLDLVILDFVNRRSEFLTDVKPRNLQFNSVLQISFLWSRCIYMAIYLFIIFYLNYCAGKGDEKLRWRFNAIEYLQYLIRGWIKLVAHSVSLCRIL
jgi:hypothetical protein